MTRVWWTRGARDTVPLQPSVPVSSDLWIRSPAGAVTLALHSLSIKLSVLTVSVSVLFIRVTDVAASPQRSWLVSRRKCVRGWACEFNHPGYLGVRTIALLGGGSGALLTIMLVLIAITICSCNRKLLVAVRGIHIFMLCCFPFWMAWYAWCFLAVALAKTTAFK